MLKRKTITSVILIPISEDNNDDGDFEKKQNDIGGKKNFMRQQVLRKGDIQRFLTLEKNSEIDSNGHTVNSYLRRVPNDLYQMSCCVCDW